ncbi:MAG: hypothetical protein Tsb0019_20680 [Roseibium sp.]
MIFASIAEAANNADTASALIPALTVGIPGTAVAAVTLGGLLVHGLQPGPMPFRGNPDVVSVFTWQFLSGAILLILPGGSLATNSFARLLNLPRPLLGPVIILIALDGLFSTGKTRAGILARVFFPSILKLIAFGRQPEADLQCE